MKRYILFAIVPVLLFSLQEVDASSMIFTTDTTITTDQIISAGETWIIEDGVTLTLDNITITNHGQIINNGTIADAYGKTSIINNYNIIENDGVINLSTSIINNYNIIENNGAIYGAIAGNNMINNYNIIENNGEIGQINIKSNGTILNNGSIATYRSYIINHGLFTNNNTIVNEWGPIINHGTIINNNLIQNIDVLFNCDTK
jgi:hypothetical protein